MYFLGDPNNLPTFRPLQKNQYYKGPSFQDRLTFDIIGSWDIKIWNAYEKDTLCKIWDTKLNGYG